MSAEDEPQASTSSDDDPIAPPPPPPPPPQVADTPPAVGPSMSPPVTATWGAPPPWTGEPMPVARKARWPWILVAIGLVLAFVVVFAAVAVVGVRTESTESIGAGSADDDDSTRPSVPVSERPPASELFEGDGYTIYVDRSWSSEPQASPQTDAFWFVEFGTRFSTNVNVITEDLPFAMKLDSYVDVSIRNAPKILGSELRALDRSEVRLANDDIGARIEWSATIQGNDLRFLQIMVVDGRSAVVVTFSALEEDFDSQVVDVEPYLLTIVPTN